MIARQHDIRVYGIDENLQGSKTYLCPKLGCLTPGLYTSSTYPEYLSVSWIHIKDERSHGTGYQLTK